jgi:hypothetical protein
LRGASETREKLVGTIAKGSVGASARDVFGMIDKEKIMNNIHGQAGERSVTPTSHVEPTDGQKVKLLPGTGHGQVGEIIILSVQRALSEIAAGRATAV